MRDERAELSGPGPLLTGGGRAGGALLFFAQLRALARHRLDYPVEDDWRYYRAPLDLPDTLTWEWLAFPAFDTLHATGKLLDWSFLRLVSHDYQGLAVASFALTLGGWLVCAALLCWRVARGDRWLWIPSGAPVAIPLAGAPYWVTTSPFQWLEPAIAYHQALPVLGLFFSAALVSRGTTAGRGALAAAVLVSLACALSYASGALALATFGFGVASLAPFAWRSDPARRNTLLAIGGAVGAAGLLCGLAHVGAPGAEFGVNPLLESRLFEVTGPQDPRFGAFLLALFDRAWLATAVDAAGPWRGAAAVLVFVVPGLGLAVRLWRGSLPVPQRDHAVALIALLAATFAYAVVVAYGRAGFGGWYFTVSYSGSFQAALYAKSRFFYWWISAALPVAVLAWGVWLAPPVARGLRHAVPVVLVVLMLLPKPQWRGDAAHEAQGTPRDGAYAAHWRYDALYERDASELAELIAIDVRRSRGGAGLSPRRRAWVRLPETEQNPRYRPYEAGELHPHRVSLYERARALDANFVERWELR